MNAAASVAGSPWLRRLRTAVLVALVLLALFALAGFFLVPQIAKSRIESVATTELGRRATLGKVEFNPFTLRARLSDFVLADREPDRTLLKFASLDVDLSMASLRRWAPVFDAVRLVRPELALVRNADGSYNVDDLVERALAGPKGPTPEFSINNIEIDDGAVSLDDRLHRRKIALTQLGIGIPFLSSLRHEAEIRVTPRLEGAVDGARFALAGTSTTPFADTHEATLELNLDALALPQYVQYAPLPGRLKLTDGALTTRLILAFVTEKGTPRAIKLSGTARIDRLRVARSDDSQLASARSVEIVLGSLDPLERSIAVDRLAIDAAEMELRRFAGGDLELQRLLDVSDASGSATARNTDDPARAWRYSIAEARLANGTLRIADSAVSPAFVVPLSNVKLDAKKIASSGAGTVDVAFDSEEGAHFDAHADVDVAGRTGRGRFSLTQFRLAKLYPYYAQALNLDVRRGNIDLAGDFTVAASASPMQVTLTGGSATLADLEMGLPGERNPLWRIPRADLTGVGFDLGKREIAIDKAECREAALRIVRQSDGTVDFQRLVRPNAAAEATPAPANPEAADAGWRLQIHKLLFERIAAEFEDRVPRPAVRLKLADMRISADNFSNAKSAKATIEIAGRIGNAGRLQLTGALVANPFAVDWRVNARGIDLVPLRPYFESRTNVIVTGGAVGVRGRVAYAPGGTSAGRFTYAGDVTVSDFGSLDRPTSQELMRWKSLTLTGVVAASEPFKLALGGVALDRFYARLILNSDATLNIAQLLAPPRADAKPQAQITKGPGVAIKELPAPADEPKELPVSIGRIQFSDGEVQFSDFFVRPNYSAHLTQVVGSVSALSATKAGDVEIAGRVENTAPVEVRGTLNPFARELMLDLTAKASDVDLPPLTPYSVKYAGYGIQKGKLSLEVHYRVENRKLAASNKLKLDQLTFGERVESPTATKLPVLLAVALLKDRSGVINLDLPIEGTLDDPKFSVWGIIVQIVVNLITKAVTAPFALLGAIAGGTGGEQLAFVEFAPGRAEITPAAETKLRSLAKALADRPNLKLDAAGRAVPDVDRDGLKRVALDRAMRVQKQKAQAGQGESTAALDALTIDAAEYPKFLAAVYRDADLPDKPRNVLGMAKDVPPAEMETLLLASYRADDEALRTLANRRASVVKDWFAGPGAIASERVFVVAPKLTSDGVGDKGAATRVDFSIR